MLAEFVFCLAHRKEIVTQEPLLNMSDKEVMGDLDTLSERITLCQMMWKETSNFEKDEVRREGDYFPRSG